MSFPLEKSSQEMSAEYTNGFPYPPYKSQEDLMAQILAACQYEGGNSAGRRNCSEQDGGYHKQEGGYDSPNVENVMQQRVSEHTSTADANVQRQGVLGLFESPTGTGKSMSLICALSKFLIDYRSNPTNFEEKTKEEDKDSSTCGLPSWVTNHKKRMVVSRHRNHIEHFRNKQRERLRRIEVRRDPFVNDNGISGHPMGFAGGNYDIFTSSKRQKTLENDNDDAAFSLDHDSTVATKLKTVTKDFRQPEESGERKVQIIFCSRTHSQLSQFSREIILQQKRMKERRAKTSYSDLSTYKNYTSEEDLAKLDDIRVVTLGSRMHTCTNPEIQKISSHQCNEACQTLRDRKGCKFKRHSDLVSDRVLTEILPIEDLIEYGKNVIIPESEYVNERNGDHRTGACAYYGLRESVPEADFILAPYSCILHKKTRDALGVNIRDNIVVFDEAHNVFDACADIHSCQVFMSGLKSCQICLQRYMQKYEASFADRTKRFVGILKEILDKLFKFCEEKKAKITPSTDPNNDGSASILTVAGFLVAAGLDSVDIGEILNFIIAMEFCRKFRGFSEGVKRIPELENLIIPSSVYQVQEFLTKLVYSTNDDRIVVDTMKNENPGPRGANYAADSSTLCLKFLSLNIEEYLFDFIDDAKAVLFIGGTMEPRAEYQPLRSRALRTFDFSAPHVVPESHTYCRYIQSFTEVNANGQPSQTLQLDFRSSHRYRDDMMKALHGICEGFSKVLLQNFSPPNRGAGLVVFFPSFDFIIRFHTKFYKSRSVDDKIQIFAESRGESADILLSNFEESVKSSKSCSVLFAVVGGKVSEGINFKDNMCRCVVVVGLPYPNPKDQVLLEKMKYLDRQKERKSPKGVDSSSSTASETVTEYLSGKAYYQMKCMKAVNQCIGRAIRHKDDWASIFLLDHRYATPRIQQDISSWLRTRFRDGSHSNILGELTQFYQQRIKS